MEREAEALLQRLAECGYEAYFVGGYVRDAVLGSPVKDIDIATSATPQEIIAVFERTVPTGLQHGTVTVLWNGHPFEVTTFRKESAYEQFRRPKEVEFITSLEEDLRRRDFTMNAMAMDRARRLIDPYGGKADLDRGILRCVGNPAQRFTEDALRMVRCLRFAAEYGLEIEERTWQALLEHAALLQHIAMERVRAELERMIGGARPRLAVELLVRSGLLDHTKVPLELPLKDWNSGLPKEIEALGGAADELVRWVLFIFGMDLTPEQAGSILRKLTFARHRWESVAGVLSFDRWLRDNEPNGSAALQRAFKLAAVRFGTLAAERWLAAAVAAADSGSEKFRSMDEVMREGGGWLDEMPVIELKQLALTGSDLAQSLGRPAGPWIGSLMRKLFELAALGELKNEKPALLEAAAQIDRE